MKLMILSTMLFTGSLTWAAGAPPCMANGSELEVNNAQVSDWKHNSENEFHARAHVTGTIARVYPDATGHHHFSLRLDGQNSDTVEIVYNEDFGATVALSAGESVEACGDYITSNAPSGHYQASPDGALIHWVHKSDTPRHDSGYLMVDGTLSGGGE